jgi:proline dehydrogenase
LRNADPDRHHRAVARSKATLSHVAAFDDDATPSSSSANRHRVEDGKHGSGVGIGGVGGPTEPSPSTTTTTTATTTTTTTTRGAMDFADPASAHGSKTTPELLRAIAVLRLCRLPFLVRHSETLLKLSTKVLGRDITDGLLRRTFFGHFCAGEDGDDARRVVERLRRDNVGPILDYAAEGDGTAAATDAPPTPSHPTPPPPTAALFNQPARVYSYASEVECDRHASIFASCIRSARDVSTIPGRGFAAIKVTALGDPALLERMSIAIVEIRNLFGKFDVGGTGSIGRDEFVRCYERYFHVDDGRLTDILELLRVDHPSGSGDGGGMIDYISFSQLFTPYTLPSFTSRCRDVGPLALATPTDEEVALLGRTSERLHGLAEEAARCGTRLLIDADHTKYQPAIDNLVLELQRKYNAVDRPVVFNTYQVSVCY